jgi:hypothetical protein
MTQETFQVPIQEHRIVDRRKATTIDPYQQVEDRPVHYQRRPATDVISWSGITDLIAELRTRLQAAEERFQNGDQITAELSSRKEALQIQIESLARALATAQAELKSVEEQQDIKGQFVDELCRAEQSVSVISNACYNRKLEDLAQFEFNCSFREIPHNGMVKEGLLLKADNNSSFRRYISAVWQILFRQRESNKVGEPQIKASCERIANALEDITSQIPNE